MTRTTNAATLQERNARLLREELARNEPQWRRQFWERKRLDDERSRAPRTTNLEGLLFAPSYSLEEARSMARHYGATDLDIDREAIAQAPLVGTLEQRASLMAHQAGGLERSPRQWTVYAGTLQAIRDARQGRS